MSVLSAADTGEEGVAGGNFNNIKHESLHCRFAFAKAYQRLQG
ncbi:MAG: hypothetical protein SRB2_01099 [Desulfobacteraceae bacterium Eth-SRB2]|nr:MAG: hypothetical protein SRB2_01099 [Desulfobacteraceae bacterium Eth-SRB2]